MGCYRLLGTQRRKEMNWLKDLFWCETWSEFFRHLGLALVLLVAVYAGLWVVMLAGEL